MREDWEHKLVDNVGKAIEDIIIPSFTGRITIDINQGVAASFNFSRNLRRVKKDKKKDH